MILKYIEEIKKYFQQLSLSETVKQMKVSTRIVQIMAVLGIFAFSTQSKSTYHPSFLFGISRHAISIRGGQLFLRLQSAFRGLSNLGGTVVAYFVDG